MLTNLCGKTGIVYATAWNHRSASQKLGTFFAASLTRKKSKTTQKHNLSILLHRFEGSDEDLIEAIHDRYIGTNPKEELKSYTGEENEMMNRPITVGEVRGAIQGLRTRSARAQTA